MSNKSIAGIVGALLTFFGVTFFFTNLGKPSNQPFVFNPIEAVNAIGFTLGFGLGFPTPLAFLTGLAVIALITVGGFYIGRNLYTRFAT